MIADRATLTDLRCRRCAAGADELGSRRLGGAGSRVGCRDVRAPDSGGVEHAGRRARRSRRREVPVPGRGAVPRDRLPLPGDDRHARRRRRDLRRQRSSTPCRSTRSPSRTRCRQGPVRPRPRPCCLLRKVVPLRRTLAGYDAWVTGVRRVEAPTRANTPLVTFDDKHGLVKLNPIAAWTRRARWTPTSPSTTCW